MNKYLLKLERAFLIDDDLKYLGIVPLSDLVNLCQKRFPNKTPLQLLSQFRTKIASHYCDNFLHGCSMEEMWLLFYMIVYHNKRWDEDKKTWINL